MTSRAKVTSRKPSALTPATFARALDEICRRDEDLARVVAEFGRPPMWGREPGFPTLVLIILEQQVSLASARAAYERLAAAASPLTPHALLAFDDAALRSFGFSRQKTDYTRRLARAVLAGHFDPHALGRMTDDAARAELIKLKGVGAWTAEIYLLMALRRPDAFPASDLALMIAAERVKRLSARPSADELNALAEGWRPWRSVAARVLWQHYLGAAAARRKRTTA
jgi:DNA-3-methyladenine glycosylase II